MERAFELGKGAGLHYIYLGNVPGEQAESTFCHQCGAMLIERVGYTINANNIEDDACPRCNTKVAGFQL